MAGSDDPKAIVARGYDAIALRYAEWAGTVKSPGMAWVRDLLARLPDGRDVLELGCGRGVPFTRELAKRHRVVGVDISAAQVALARHHVPEATFVHADAAEVEFPAAAFDAVVSLYMLGHVPRGEQPALLGRIAEWLRPGGYLLATLARGGYESVEEDWLGAPMFFSSFDEETNRQHLGAAGFEVLRDETIGQLEHGTEARFQWVLARTRQTIDR